jgi:hypothetical protein
MYMKNLLLLVLVLLGSFSVFGQQGKNNRVMPQQVKSVPDTMPKPHNLQVIGRSYGDSVVLRWAPAQATLWHFANKAGYQVVRYEVVNKRMVPGSRKVLTALPLKPWTLDEWKQKSQRTDSMAGACAQLLYGKSKEMTPQAKKNNGVNLKQAMDEKYEMENEQAMALFLADQSPRLATGLGLRYVDKTITKGKTYAYAVFALTDPKTIKSDTSGVLINTSEEMPIPEMPAVTVEELDRKVKFTWNRAMGSMYFTAYNYERSNDGGKTFKKINKRPYIQLTTDKKLSLTSTIELEDSLPKNYVQYYYRIVGITPFGDFGKPTPNLSVMGKDRTPPFPPDHISAKNTRGNKVHLTWMKKTKEPDFVGYLIGRSDKASGPFLPLTLEPLSPVINEFTDTSAFPHGTNYYIVSAIDTAGNAGSSVPAYAIMTDTIPPAKPVGLSGKVDTSGIVHLKWRMGKEEDLMGYLVYSANAPDHKFIPVSHDFVADTTFSDSITLNTLTKHIYYKVVAFDKNRNPSPYSDALELKRPDKVAPVSPVFTKFLVTDTSVVLNWATSTSNDVVSQQLYRRENGKDWQPYAKLEVTTSSFVDHNVKKLTWYDYCLEAVDDAGLHSSKSFPLNVRVYDSGKRPNIQNFTIVKSQDGKSLILSWKYAETGNYWYELYRSIDGKNFMTIKSLSADQHTFTDGNLKRAAYQYAIKAVYKDGGESQQVKSTKIDFVPAGK